ncbi:hypothetical protein DFH08DRAFT_854700 [Mycena albidolilacea]|uniref:Uncharacterized protein n=1 Tax=Mycena albidolilacea TaxID=1033008 RepID=A0AAD7ABM6_9AGAR|nr:hypothetical protein DFH08DRAFT_854700 [Mycena albidolilacea]
MLSFPRLVLSATLLLGASCGANDTPTRPAARLTQLKPFAEPRVRPRETIIRGLLASRVSQCEAGFNLCDKTGCCGSNEICCQGGGCCAAGQFCVEGGCCPKGQTCSGSGQQCPSGFEACPNNGGCCPAGHTCILATDGSAVGCKPADAVSSSSRASSTAKSSATKNSSSRVTSTPFSASESAGTSSGSSATANSAGTASGVSSSTPSTSKRAATPVGGIAGGVVGGVAVLATVVGIFIFCRRRRFGYHGRLPDELTPYSMPANQQTGADYASHRGSAHTHSVLTRLPSGAVMMSPSGNSAHEPPHRAPVFDVTSTESPGTRSQLLRARQSELERQTREINRELEELRHGDVPSASSSIVASRGDSDAQRDIKMMEDQMRTLQRRQELSNEAPPSYSSF